MKSSQPCWISTRLTGKARLYRVMFISTENSHRRDRTEFASGIEVEEEPNLGTLTARLRDIISVQSTMPKFFRFTGSIVPLSLLLLSSLKVNAEDYGSLMQREVKRVLGDKDLKGYQFISYPTNNFGLMTMYILEKKNDKPSAKNQWCATFTCLGLKGKEPTEPKAIENVNGYADIGSGGPITLSEDEKKSLSFSAVLPKILQVLDIGGNLDFNKGVTTTMSLGPATMRFLVKQTALDYLKSQPDSSEIKKAFQEGRLAIVIADVVISSLDVTLKVDKSTNAGLNAQLSGKVNQVFGSGDQLQVKVGNSTNGGYTLKITQPVIVARLTVTKPFGTTRGGNLPTRGAPALNPWNRDWEVTQALDNTALQK